MSSDASHKLSPFQNHQQGEYWGEKRRPDGAKEEESHTVALGGAQKVVAVIIA